MKPPVADRLVVSLGELNGKEEDVTTLLSPVLKNLDGRHQIDDCKRTHWY